MTANNFERLALAQKAQQTNYNGGLDPHGFGGFEESMAIYGNAIPASTSSEFDKFVFAFQGYVKIAKLCGIKSEEQIDKLGRMVAAIEMYLTRHIKWLVEDCNIRTFKPQSAFYEQFGPCGTLLLFRVRDFINQIAKEKDIDLVCTLDCKRGDIFTTQAAYFNAIIGNLMDDWGIDYSPFDFDIMNVTPWMGSDVMVLYDNGKPAKGLKLMRAGKGIIGVSKSSNPSGPEYQELIIDGLNDTIQMKHVRDMAKISRDENLEENGLSTIGLVVGSTHVCDGSIRIAFPTTTMLVPGFGAQGGKFDKIMLELIRTDNQWNGQGAIFSSSRGTLYPHLTKYSGSGSILNLRDDLIKSITKFRENEKKAYEDAEVVRAGISYPYAMTA